MSYSYRQLCANEGKTPAEIYREQRERQRLEQLRVNALATHALFENLPFALPYRLETSSSSTESSVSSVPSSYVDYILHPSLDNSFETAPSGTSSPTTSDSDSDVFYFDPSDPHSNLPNLVKRKYNFNMLPQKPPLLTVDEDIPDLPPNPFDQTLILEPSANITIKQHQHHKFNKLYNDYHLLKCNIFAAESSIAPANRTARLSSSIRQLRKRINAVYDQLQPLIDKINQITAVQETLRPVLQVPTNGNPGANFQLDLRDVKEFIGQSLKQTDPDKRLAEVWKKLVTYAELKNLSHNHFKLALTASLTGDQYDYVLSFPKATVPKLAALLAARFVNENVLSDAIHELDNFQRNANEPIRQAVARLQTCLERAIVMYPEDERATIKTFQTDTVIKQIVSPKARALIDKQAAEARTQGVKLSTSTLVRLAEDEEKRSGLPDTERARPVQLYNSTVTEPHSNDRLASFDQRLDQITSTLDHITAHIFQQNEDPTFEQDMNDPLLIAHLNSVEANPAIKSVRFNQNKSSKPYGSSRPSQPSQKTSSANPFSAAKQLQSSYPSSQFSQFSTPSSYNTSSPRNSYTTNFDPLASQNPNFPNFPPKLIDNSDQTMTDRSQTRSNSNNSQNRSSRSSVSPATFYRDKYEDLKSKTRHPSKSPGRQSDSSSRSRRDNYHSQRYKDDRYRQQSQNRARYDSRSRDHSQNRSSNYRNSSNNFTDTRSSYERDLDYSLHPPNRNRYDQNRRDFSRDRNYSSNNRRDYSRDNNRRDYSRDRNYARDNSSNRYNGNNRSSNTYGRSPSRNGYNRQQASHAVNAHDNATVNVNGKCSFCNSTIAHNIKDCYAVKSMVKDQALN